MLTCTGSKRLAKLIVIDGKVAPLCPICGKQLAWDDIDSGQFFVVPNHPDQRELDSQYADDPLNGQHGKLMSQHVLGSG